MHPFIPSILIFIVMVILFVVAFDLNDCVDENCLLNHLENEAGSRLLSRRKRFIIFPEGSSFQLVLCVQTSALIPIGDIFLYGNTIALAWNLPTEPKHLLMFKDFYKDAQRRGDQNKKVIYYNEGGRIVQEVPYRRKTIINPVFAKRSISDPGLTYKEKLQSRLERARMHQMHLKRDYLNHHSDSASTDFHRSKRVELYGRIEKLLKALGQDGRNCVLYKLCMAARGRTTQGTFLQEFLRAVFTLPKGTIFEREDHRVYDEAHDRNLDCDIKYTGCKDIDVNFI